MASKPAKTKKPTGLGIGLASKKFTFSWKIGDKDYAKGQQLYYGIHTTTLTYNKKTKKTTRKNATTKKYFGSGKTPQNIGVKVTSKTTPAFDWNNYFPKKQVLLNGLTFYVRGKKDKCDWSDWSKKVFDVMKPPKPTVVVALSQDYENQCIFEWGNSRDLKVNEIRTYWQYRTGLSANKSAAVTFGPWQTVTSASKTIKENITFVGTDYSYTRKMQVRACGPQGASDAVEKKWVYAYPSQAANVKANAVRVAANNGYKVSTTWTANNSATHPIDKVTVQYSTTQPDSRVSTSGGVVRTTLSCPAGASWTDGGTYLDNAPVRGNDTDGLVFNIDGSLDADHCIFARVNTYHNPKTTYGAPVIAAGGFGALPNPTLSNVSVDSSTNIATITATNNSGISASFLGVYYRTSTHPNQNKLVGIIPAGATVAYVKLPTLTSGTASIGVRAFVGDYSPVYTPASGASASVINYTIPKAYMSSPEIIWQRDAIAAAPTVSLVQVPNKVDTVRVTWNWSWLDATEAEISWADHDDAWESTDEPTTYSVSTAHASQWNVTGLDVGTWYFRVRLVRRTDNSEVYGAYSEIKEIKLASSPAIPALWPTSATISQTGSVTLSWAYTSEDGTSQMQGEMCEAQIQSDGSFIYGEPFTRSGVAQNITVNAEERGWIPNTPIDKYYITVDTEVVAGKQYYSIAAVDTPVVGDIETYYEPSGDTYILTADTEIIADKTYYIFTPVNNPTIEGLPNYYELHVVMGPTTYYVAVRVISTAGEQSDGWSIPVPITIADPPSLMVRETSLQNIEVVVDDDTQEKLTQLSLTEMPLTISTSGAGQSGLMTYIIERAADYHVERPDESEYDGFEGETVALISRLGEEDVAIDQVDLLGVLDDGAKYNLIITLEDIYGQTAYETIPFYVHWTHQALMPEADVSIDSENNVAFITPIAPRRYFLTEDTEIIVSKQYYGIQAVANPIDSEIASYFELSPTEANVYIPTEDIAVIGGKTYYEGSEIETPVEGSIATYYEMGYLGDTCDIYRLSVDTPELIVKDAMFGTKYVDPFPTLGTFGGHRIVYKTINGDYIIGDNTLAMNDYTEEDGDIIHQFATIINFGNNEVVLPYDIGLSSKWSKDFIETKYLGGSIQGDWNPAVSRSSSVTTRTAIFEDPETIELMRRLAVYPGMCHVRTPEGSSFSANVEVSEDQEEKMINKIARFSLDITRVESEQLDGITYDEWIAERET